MKTPKLLGSSPERTWLWLSIGAVAVIIVVARWALYMEQRSFLTLQNTYGLIVETDEVWSNFVDTETAGFSYVMTKEPGYLKSYDNSRKIVYDQLDELIQFTRDDPTQRARVERLRPFVQKELEDLSARMQARNSLRRETIRGVVPTQYRNERENAHQIINELKDVERISLKRFSKYRQSKVQTGVAALISSALFASSCLLLGQFFISRNVFRRQKAEEELEASEKRFEILCEQAPVGIYETDAGGMCIYTNRRWSEISGLSANESLGHGWTRVLHPDDRATIFEGWQEAASQGASWEYRIVTAHEEMRWIRALGGPIHSARGDLSGYVGTLEDITERKLTDRALQEQATLNRAILNSLPAKIAVLKRDGTVEAANEAWQHFAEVSKDSPVCFVGTGSNYLEACKQAVETGSKDAEKALAGILEVLHGRTHYFGMQYPYQAATEVRWFHMIVVPLAAVATGGAVIAHVDITQQKRAEERFRLVVEGAPNAMVVVNGEGKMVLVNSRTEKLFGYGRKELLGRSIELLIPEPFHNGSHSPPNEMILNCLLGGAGYSLETLRTQPGLDVRAQHKSGTQFPVEISLNPIETDEGIWVLTSIVDLTERQQANAALRQSRQELRALAGCLMNAREEERRRISRQLHDDLSQRLALLAFDTGGLVLAPPSSCDQVKEQLRSIQRRIVDLSEDIRQIAHQLHPSILEDLGLTAALRELCEEFSARERIHVIFEQEAVPETLPMEVASCFYGVAQEALYNVLKHALVNEVNVKLCGSHDGVRLTVRDYGVGFDTEVRKHPGLGIISMKERIRLVQGELALHSKPGLGTTVSAFVPLPQEVA